MSSSPPAPESILSRLVLPIFSIWFAVWLVIGWGALQDDAFIHLRYADMLHRFHFITYDGIHLQYGTSSLLYVGLLAVLRSLTTSPFLPSAVSSFFLILLFVAGCVFYRRAARTKSRNLQYFAICFLVLLIAPSGVRWLSDGMETGLVLCVISGLAWWTHRLSLRDHTEIGSYLICMVFGAVLVFLRTELLAAAAFACAILCLQAGGNVNRSGWIGRVLSAIPSRSHFLIGAAIGALAIRLMMHHFLPDTALAKSGGFRFFWPTLFVAGRVLVSAFIFGIGMVGLWLLSAAITLSRRCVRTAPTLMANAIPILILLASAMRGQEIQGARHVAWIFFFPIVWNFLELRDLERAGTESSPSRFPLVALGTYLVGCLILLPLDAHYIDRVLATRVHLFKVISSQDLGSVLEGKRGVASDVGFISYFGKGAPCDLAGLVNGRAAATTPPEERARLCAALHPSYAFVNAGQAAVLGADLDMSQWKVCGEYDLATVSSPDRHYLVVKPDLAAAVCKATGRMPAPYSAALVSPSY